MRAESASRRSIREVLAIVCAVLAIDAVLAGDDAAVILPTVATVRVLCRGCLSIDRRAADFRSSTGSDFASSKRTRWWCAVSAENCDLTGTCRDYADGGSVFSRGER